MHTFYFPEFVEQIKDIPHTKTFVSSEDCKREGRRVAGIIQRLFNKSRGPICVQWIENDMGYFEWLNVPPAQGRIKLIAEFPEPAIDPITLAQYARAIGTPATQHFKLAAADHLSAFGFRYDPRHRYWTRGAIKAEYYIPGEKFSPREFFEANGIQAPSKGKRAQLNTWLRSQGYLYDSTENRWVKNSS